MGDMVPANASSAGALIAVQQEASKEIAAQCTGGKFLPQLRLTNPKSKAVEDGEIKPYQYVLMVDSEIEEDFGQTLDIFVCAMRNRASREIDGETYISFDQTSEFYQHCLAASEAKERAGQPLAGRELLVFLPDIGVFATFLFGNKTMRRTANSKFRNIVGKNVSCFVKDIPKLGYKTVGLRVHREGDMSADDLPLEALKSALTIFGDMTEKLPGEAADGGDDDR